MELYILIDPGSPYQLIGGVPGPGPDLPGAGGELVAAAGAVEVVRVVHLAAEAQRVAVDRRAGTDGHRGSYHL